MGTTQTVSEILGASAWPAAVRAEKRLDAISRLSDLIVTFTAHGDDEVAAVLWEAMFAIRQLGRVTEIRS